MSSSQHGTLPVFFLPLKLTSMSPIKRELNLYQTLHLQARVMDVKQLLVNRYNEDQHFSLHKGLICFPQDTEMYAEADG